MTTEQDLAGIKERAEKATPGPWYAEQRMQLEKGCRCMSCYEPALGEFIIKSDVHDLAESDADFIAHARTDIPALLTALTAATLRATKAEEAERGLREALEKIAAGNKHETWNGIACADIARAALQVKA